MTERKRVRTVKSTPSKAAPPPRTDETSVDLMGELRALEAWNEARRLKERGLPEAWDQIAWGVASGPRKTRISVRMDADVAGWFQALGPDCESRINAVLRLYMLGVLSKEIDTPEDFDWRGERI